MSPRPWRKGERCGGCGRPIRPGSLRLRHQHYRSQHHRKSPPAEPIRCQCPGSPSWIRPPIRHGACASPPAAPCSWPSSNPLSSPDPTGTTSTWPGSTSSATPPIRRPRSRPWPATASPASAATAAQRMGLVCHSYRCGSLPPDPACAHHRPCRRPRQIRHRRSAGCGGRLAHGRDQAAQVVWLNRVAWGCPWGQVPALGTGASGC
jgi:hypothetical protein